MYYLKSGVAESCWTRSNWTKTHIAVPTPLSATSRCAVRFLTFQEAQRACCSMSQCDAIAVDNGILCRHRMHEIELRSGMRHSFARVL